jgi:hypothetical protein
MAKRLKTVFANHDACAHVWASQTQYEGRSGPMFFRDASIFSYGSHFEIARIVEHRGVKVALFNRARYSNTTAKHQSAARRAVRHVPILYTSNIDKGVESAFKEARELILTNAAAQLKARRPQQLHWIEDEVTEHNERCAKLKLKRLQFKLPKKLRKQIRDHVIKRTLRNDELDAKKSERQKKQREQAERLRVEREAEDRRLTPIELADWKAGAERTARVTRVYPQSIRVRGGVVQTSGGAEVPLMEATQLLARVEAGIAKEGDSVGSFTFNGVEDGFALIGCHRISIEEAKQVLFGRSLQLLKGGR